MINIYSKKTLLIILLLVITAFLVWRFIRPLNIFVIDERFERPIHVNIPEGLGSVSAKECGKCHKEIYKEWSESMHAMAWTDPYYLVDYEYDGSQQICLNCHTPLENQQNNLVLGFKDREKFDPILKPNPDYDSSLRDEGVTCAVCHIRDGKIVGPFKTDNSPHPVIIDHEMTSGIKSCERCHVVSGKRWDTFYRIPPCGTVAEIKEGGQKIDCIGCHMPEVVRPVAEGVEARKGGRHLFRGGHHPETVSSSLKLEYSKQKNKDKIKYIFRLTNIRAAHYLPTGTPDRHLTLELRLVNNKGDIIKEKIYKMKRYILWRPFIVDIKDTRLPYGETKEFDFEFKMDNNNLPSVLDVTVSYHLLDEKRRQKIGFKNKETISYPVYKKSIHPKSNGFL